MNINATIRYQAIQLYENHLRNLHLLIWVPQYFEDWDEERSVSALALVASSYSGVCGKKYEVAIFIYYNLF